MSLQHTARTAGAIVAFAAALYVLATPRTAFSQEELVLLHHSPDVPLDTVDNSRECAAVTDINDRCIYL
jgi:hypothetical protein